MLAFPPSEPVCSAKKSYSRTKKKKQSNFRSSFCKVRAPIGRRDRFGGRKNPSNKHGAPTGVEATKRQHSDDKSPAFAGPTKEGGFLATDCATEFRSSMTQLITIAELGELGGAGDALTLPVEFQ
jgi:hypothetical protein